MKQKKRLGCGKHQFPNRDRHKASPLASPQQPVDHVFLRGLTPPKSCRPLLPPRSVAGRSPPTPIITPTVYMATGGQASRESYLGFVVPPEYPPLIDRRS